MNWRNEAKTQMMKFKDLSFGEIFEYDEIFYIKVKRDEGFDIINNLLVKFTDFDNVFHHEHEIVIL